MKLSVRRLDLDIALQRSKVRLVTEKDLESIVCYRHSGLVIEDGLKHKIINDKIKETLTSF